MTNETQSHKVNKKDQDRTQCSLLGAPGIATNGAIGRYVRGFLRQSSTPQVLLASECDERLRFAFAAKTGTKTCQVRFQRRKLL